VEEFGQCILAVLNSAVSSIQVLWVFEVGDYGSGYSLEYPVEENVETQVGG
jgi:hypothetical protein